MSFLRRNRSGIKATDSEIRIRGTKEQLRLVANRILPDDIARQYDTPFPVNFAQPFPLAGETPPGSGLAFKFSPYMQFYTKVYGVMPNADLTKYRLIYRNQPDVKARIDKRVNLAVGKGFTIQCDDPAGKDAAEWLNKWARDIKLDLMLQSAGSDMVTYGTAAQELTWSTMLAGLAIDNKEEKTVPINPGESSESEYSIRGPLRGWVEETGICPKCRQYTLMGIRQIGSTKAAEASYTFYGDINSFAAYLCTNPECKADPNNPESMPYSSAVSGQQFMEQVAKINSSRFDGQDIKVIQPTAPEAGASITYIKDLDILYIRPRADAYGNIFGYYQWINYPPVLLGPSAVIWYRWNIKSWGYETIYGTSDLMPVIRYVDMRTQFENDMVVWEHTYPHPVIHLMAGTTERPYTDDQMKALAAAWRKRQSGSDFLTKGDISSEVIQTQVGGRGGGALIEWLNYLNVQIHSPLGIPDSLMGTQGAPQGGQGSNRSTATVAMEDVIVQAELLQKALSRPWEQDMFPIMLRAQGFSEEVCELYYYFAWKPVFEEDPNTRMTNITNFRKAGIYSINQCLAQLPDQEPISKDDPRYKPEYDMPDYPVPAPGKSTDQIQAEADAKASSLAPTSLSEPEGLDQGEGTNLTAQAVTTSRRVSSFR